ncbi:MAG: glycine cleavage system protein GcvH [Pseudohongiellaceae bacterium]
MADFPGDLKYAETHEWARLETDGTITIGISDHAQESLGDVVFVELPELGAEIEARGEAGVVESVKAASDIYAPIAGRVVAINEALEDAPETVNQSPYDDGWFFKVEPEDVAELDSLLTADQYQELCDNEDH